MFEGLSEKLSGILDKLTRRGALSEEDVNLALREVRRALLEADVALDVVRSFVDKVRARGITRRPRSTGARCCGFGFAKQALLRLARVGCANGICFGWSSALPDGAEIQRFFNGH